MLPEHINQLIATGESLSVEFRETSHKALNDDELLSAVVCLANRPGHDGAAWLLIGIDDDGIVTGAHPRHDHGKTNPLRIQALIADKTVPSVPATVEVVTIDDL